MVMVELKACYLETSSQTGPEALTSALMMTWTSNYAIWKQAHRLAQKLSICLLSRSRRLCWASLAALLLARLASTSKLAEVAEVVVVVVLRWWWC